MPYGIDQGTWNRLPPDDRAAIIADYNASQAAAAPASAAPATSPPSAPAPGPAPTETLGGVPVAQAIQIATVDAAIQAAPDVAQISPTEELGGVSVAQAIQIAADYGLPAPGAPTVPPTTTPADLGPLPGWDFLDPFADEFFAAEQASLKGQAAVDELYAACDLYGIDVLASAANAIHEGAGGGIGDDGTAYGPWQLHATDGRLPSFTGKGRNNPIVQAWAWSPNGFEYVMRAMAQGGARGLHGHPAVHAIVYGFERPADMAGAYATRAAEYDHLLALGSQARSYLNGAFRGPTVGAGATVPTVPVAPVRPGAQSAWREVIDALKTTQPRAAAHVRAIAGEFLGLVR